MKYFIQITIIILLGVIISSCSTSDEPTQVEKVTVHFDYTLMQSGTLSRTVDDAYSDYYEKCILTRQNTPTQFEVTLSYQNNDIETIKGFWDDENSFCLPVGEYNVRGKSYPQQFDSYPTHYAASDSVFMKFAMPVNVEKNTHIITFTASYDCYLLLFKSDNIESIKCSHCKYAGDDADVIFSPSNGYYGIYVSGRKYNTYVSYLHILKKNGVEITITLQNPRFENGKYYYFNDATDTFFLDKMEDGSK